MLAPLDGPPIAAIGDPAVWVYPRSALKPLQAVAVQAQLAAHHVVMDATQLALTSASHDGSDLPQLLAAEMLAQAGLDEAALRCPAAWPADPAVRSQLTAPTRLSHNCSGKHAAMVWAHTVSGGDPESYLDPESTVQRLIAETLGQMIGAPVTGPAVDGCGAPAWRCTLGGMAHGFARLLAGAEPGLAAVRDGMLRFPHLIGGQRLPDTRMMWADGRVVAKRGAEGVMVAAFHHPRRGPVGVCVKITDGSDRAAGPLAAAVLHAMGATLDDDLLRVPVLGGAAVVGAVAATADVAKATLAALA